MGSSFFAYDARSRLKTGLGQSFDYDRWGNLNPLGVNPMTNRIKAGGYDSRGNMVRSGTQTFRYDELSRQVAVDGGKERYLYDGAGERIARVTSTAPGLSLYTITPCRIRDTRDPPAMLAPFVPFTVQVTGGPSGIPPEAEALAGNLTALGSSQAGFILAQPAGTAGLDTSTINFAAGQTRANNFNVGRSEEHTSELQSQSNLVCRPPRSTLFPYMTLFRSAFHRSSDGRAVRHPARGRGVGGQPDGSRVVSGGIHPGAAGGNRGSRHEHDQLRRGSDSREQLQPGSLDRRPHRTHRADAGARHRGCLGLLRLSGSGFSGNLEPDASR